MRRETTGPVINLRLEVDEVRLKAGFGEEVRLTREVWVDDNVHEFVSRYNYHYLFTAGDPVWHLTLSETLPDGDVYPPGRLWETPEEIKSQRPLEVLDEVVTALRLLKPQGVWLPLVWGGLWSDEGNLLASSISSLGERWEACEEYVPGQTAREQIEAWTGERWPAVDRYRLEAADIPELQNLLDGLSRRPLDRPDGERSRTIEIAISRFNMALDRPRPEDQVIDLSVALEALFMNPDESNHIKRKVSVRGANYLEDSDQGIKELSEQVRGWYKDRCAIVHGGEPSHDLFGVVNGLASVVRGSLRKALAAPASLARVREDFRGSAN